MQSATATKVVVANRMSSLVRFARVGIAGGVLALSLPSMTIAGTIYGAAYGNILGAPFNPAPGETTNCSYGNGGSPNVSSGSCGYTTTGTIGVKLSGGPDWSAQGDEFVGNVSSSVDPGGNLHAVATAQFNNQPTDVNFIQDNLIGSSTAYADAYAYSWDILSFTNTVPIQVIFSVSLDGSFYSLDHQETQGYANFGYYVYANGANTGNIVKIATDGAQTFQTAAAVINPGATAQYTLSLQTHAELDCTALYGTHLCSANESADFSNTARLTGITIEDLNGNVLSGVGVSSISGYDYSSLLAGPSAAVPEPGSILLAAIGLAACLVRRRRAPRAC